LRCQGSSGCFTRNRGVVESTQVIEAGIDLADLLVTDAAPWPSPVQRLGQPVRQKEHVRRREPALESVPVGLVAVVPLVLLCAAGAAAQDQDWLAKARSARQAGDYLAAAEAYSHLLSADPENPQMLSNVGIMLHMAGKHEEALRPLRKALQHAPGTVPANLFAGLSLVALNRPGEALPYLERARDGDPSGPLPLIGLGKAHSALEHFRDANEYFDRATQIDPRNLEAWLGVGMTYRHLAQSVNGNIGSLASAAAAQLDEATKQAGKPSTRAEMLDAERQLDRDPKDLTSLVRLARACAAMAVSSLTKAVELSPESYEAHLALAGAWEETHSTGHAVREYEAAIRLRSDDGFVYMRLAFLHWSAGNNEQALPPLEKALKLTPDDPQVNACMGDILVRSGKHGDARPYLEKALRGNPELAMAHIAMAQIHTVENHPELAAVEIRKALPQDRDGSYYYMLSKVLRQLGRDQEAQSALEQYSARQALKRTSE
jgi:tetratricopeptide (TPR) repeat protein